MLFRLGPHAITMATAKTGSFYLTETVQIPVASAADTRVQGVIDLGAYVNVPTGQAVAVEAVDFIYQHSDTFSQAANFFLQLNGCISAQLSDLNPGTAFVRADDQSLIASGAMNLDTLNSISSNEVDLYPDNFGPSNLSEAFLVVNDSLYLVGGNNGSATSLTDIIYITVRIKCRVVKLSTKDWMAIAIQSTASDN
jgi:hypothetical protein